jgi:hypothetical protein
MSTLRVNSLEPTSGNSVTVNSELLIKGPGGDIIVGGTGSSNLSASYAATAGCASNINISTIVPGDTTTSVVLVNNQAVGCQSPFIDAGLTYNAATNILDTTVTTAQTASYVAASNINGTVANATNAIFATTATIATSSLTASYVNPLNQEVIINGNVTASGDIRLTTSGSAVVRPIINLVPTGTASFDPNSTNTTTYSNYGINVISTASSQSYCLRLPQTPTQGKTVTLINKSGINVLVFPSVIGGDINGVIDGYLVIPSDGKSYSFDCYENPLPGGWSVTNVNASSTTITSGVINYNYTSSAGHIAFVNDLMKTSGSSFGSANAYNGLNATQYLTGTSISYFGSPYVFGRIYPDTITGQNTWNSINSVQVLTNLSASNVQAYLRLSLGTNIEFYENANPTGPVQLFFPSGPYNTFNTNVLTPWINNHPGTINSVFYSTIQLPPQTTSVVPGIFVSSSQNPYTSANVGDPGTLIINIPSLPTYTAAGGGFKMLGRNYIGSFVHPVQGLLDAYYNAEFCPIFSLSVFDNLFNNVSNVPNAKLQVSYNVSL